MRTRTIGTTAGLSALLLAAACGAGKAPADASAGGAPAVPVTVGLAERRDMPERVRAVGTVESPAAVTLEPRIDGEVAEVLVKEGADVLAGDLLIVLDRAPSQATLAAAEAALARDTVLSRDAQRNAESWASVGDQRAVAQRTLESARATADAAAAEVAVDAATVDAARLRLQWCEIRAPFAGRCGRVLVRRGSAVTEGETELLTLRQITPIRVAFPVPERRLATIQARHAQGPLAVDVRAPGGEALHGELGFIDSAVDRDSGSILLMADLPNADLRLWPGQLVDVELTVGVDRDVVVVPAGAVQRSQAGDAVFVVEDGVARLKDVQLLRLDGELAVLSAGLSGGETVVTDGQLRLVPGARVQAAGAEAR